MILFNVFVLLDEFIPAALRISVYVLLESSKLCNCSGEKLYNLLAIIFLQSINLLKVEINFMFIILFINRTD